MDPPFAGLDILKDMLTKVAMLPEEQAQPFYKKYGRHKITVVRQSVTVAIIDFLRSVVQKGREFGKLSIDRYGI